MRLGWCAWLAACLMLCTAVLLPMAARADEPVFSEFGIFRNQEGLHVSFALRFDLPRDVEDALQKGVPLYFVAEAELYRDRWYWRDRRINTTSKVWRVAYQPLTRKYRVTFGGLNQNFDRLDDALAAVRRVSDWKVAEASQVQPGSGHYLELSYRLDTTLLPRPMQIGIGGQPEWTLLVEKFHRVD
jgi:hypothetical protein